jgi:hypothetical protein
LSRVLRMQSIASLSLLINCRWLRHSSDLARSVSASTRNSESVVPSLYGRLACLSPQRHV